MRLHALGLAVTLLAVPSVDARLEPSDLRIKAQPFGLTDVRLLDGPFRRAMQLDAHFILSLDQDRLLHNFRINAGLPSSSKPLGGWEAPDVELRGHTVGHYLSALALMYAATGDEQFKARAVTMVGSLAVVQDALAKKYHPGYLSAFPEEFFDRVDARQRVWAPYYTIHKIMAGLFDVNQLCGSAQALEMLTKMADWVQFRVDRLTDDQQQTALETEYGGMNEVLANLSAVTGESKYLTLARKFDHKRLFDPLAAGEDPLDGIHGNTQIPKMIGAAREYELTGETRYRDIASFFWNRVAHYRSYVMGGDTDGERFFPIAEFSKHLNAAGPETCNTYNMLKLTRHLFEWSPSTDAMDFYERALFNHILPSQDSETGMMSYYCPLRPGAYRTYSTPDDSFWCCVGTGMENHAKYGDAIYFHDDRTLWVNLFIASELQWRDRNVTVVQDTHFPDEDATRLTIRARTSSTFTIAIRRPAWAISDVTVALNGHDIGVRSVPGSYVTLDREWRDGDRLEIRMPMTLHVERMPADSKMLALLYGPIVLAGDLGRDGMESVKRYGPSAPPLGRTRTPVVPAFVADVKEAPAITERLTLQSRVPLRFRTDGLGQPNDVTLMPLSQTVDNRFTVYWKLYSSTEWRAKKNEAAELEAHRQAIERRSVDTVSPDNEQGERTHNYRNQGGADVYFEGRRLREARDGWFSYEVAVKPDRPMTLACTYRGSEGRRRSFEISVDGEKIATQTLEYHPTELFDFEYDIPESLTRGKERVTVRFAAGPDAAAGPLVELHTITR